MSEVGEKNIEDKLDEMEDKLNYVILQINSLKQRVSDSNPELTQLLNLLQIYTNTLELTKSPIAMLGKTYSIKDKIIDRFPSLKHDNISETIITVLARKEQLNLSQLTEEVRKERGTSSRRIVRERVAKLLELGVIEEVNQGFGRNIKLVDPEHNT